MSDTPWRPHCVTHRSPVTCRGPSPGLGEVKGDPHRRQGSVEEALRSAPRTPLTLRRACRSQPTPQHGKCLTLLSLNNNKPHNMLLTYVRLLCDFCIVSISKCLCGCCFSQPRDFFVSPFSFNVLFLHIMTTHMPKFLRPWDFLSPFNWK